MDSTEKQQVPKGLLRLHVARRTMIYIVMILLGVVALLFLCVLVFLTGERYSNLYILSSEGMKARASYMITGTADRTGESDLTDYFLPELIRSEDVFDTGKYADYPEASFDYDLSVEKISVFPWSTSASVTAVEAVSVTGTISPEHIAEGKTASDYPPPEWGTYRYRIHFVLIGERWYVREIEVLSTEPVQEHLGTPDLQRSILPMATPTPTVELVDLG